MCIQSLQQIREATPAISDRRHKRTFTAAKSPTAEYTSVRLAGRSCTSLGSHRRPPSLQALLSSHASGTASAPARGFIASAAIILENYDLFIRMTTHPNTGNVAKTHRFAKCWPPRRVSLRQQAQRKQSNHLGFPHPCVFAIKSYAELKSMIMLHGGDF